MVKGFAASVVGQGSNPRQVTPVASDSVVCWVTLPDTRYSGSVVELVGMVSAYLTGRDSKFNL